VTIILCASFFLLVFFNEVWLISAAMFGPSFAFTMWQAGKDMEGTKESEELVIRTFTCLITYGIVAYMLERKGKLAFIGEKSGEKALLSFF
jgi:Na+/melibiose symporter-like transporter